MLKPSVEDPYDLMRRSRLLEPRSRARSISPLRQANQRDVRSQSVVRCNLSKERAGAKVTGAHLEPISRSEWFECAPSSPAPGDGHDRLHEDNADQSVRINDLTSPSSISLGGVGLSSAIVCAMIDSPKCLLHLQPILGARTRSYMRMCNGATRVSSLYYWLGLRGSL
jgi:hypothetical protein